MPRRTELMFLALGTRARPLVDGATSLEIHGDRVPVGAEVVNLPGFSVHSDAGETIAWLRGVRRPLRMTYVVHGEPDAAATLRDRIHRGLGWSATTPAPEETTLVQP
ncbi:MBL fold metallo-hydrolase RNA specificity domain-containing protein [Herbidospora sp. NBRC 101105]|uniref:MBL fold metallo-hydrolase RNA specificity domain-containing protein n=1 Tax=Herbidospora sp. NBRC 101105 TaxID=3032195 RepID=UPI0025551B72|nr:MBL fold metallo-hydrolase RNA specificity domain-containing protein [Herbidospora sp. NBRC 101105]